jgi:hypothetical protein
MRTPSSALESSRKFRFDGAWQNDKTSSGYPEGRERPTSTEYAALGKNSVHQASAGGKRVGRQSGLGAGAAEADESADRAVVHGLRGQFSNRLLAEESKGGEAVCRAEVGAAVA